MYNGIKLLGEIHLWDMRTLGYDPKRKKTDKLDFIKTKNISSVKHPVKMKKISSDWEKI